MAFILRSIQEKDLRDMQVLASQFTMINLPNDPQVLSEKIKKSISSFSSDNKKLSDAEYIFVVEDLEAERVVGSSMIIAKHGTLEHPHFYFKINKKEHFSSDLGIGFVHQVLKLHSDTDGPSEIGGLLVDSQYRRLSEKIGKQISLVRFLFMAMFPERFEKKLLCELSPPQMAQGKSEFWESFGRRFTGLSYQEADRMSHKHKEFISSLFPSEEIYTCLLSSSARFVLGRVGDETRPAQHLLEKIGFKYLNEVDPFDGGPHFGAFVSEIPIIKNAKKYKLSKKNNADYRSVGLVGVYKDNQFYASQSAAFVSSEEIFLPETTVKILKLDSMEEIFFTPIQ